MIGKAFRGMALGTLVLAATACAHGGSTSNGLGPVVRPLAGLSRFEPEDTSLRIQPGDTLAGGGCLNPMIGEDGVRAILVRSAAALEASTTLRRVSLRP